MVERKGDASYRNGLRVASVIEQFIGGDDSP